MSKQVLSVADFALILIMVNERIEMLERPAQYFCLGRTEKEMKEERERGERERAERLNSSYYLQLKHLQNSLQNLNIEVETPDVKVADK